MLELAGESLKNTDAQFLDLQIPGLLSWGMTAAGFLKASQVIQLHSKI